MATTVTVQDLRAKATARYNEAMEVRNAFKGNDIPAEELDRLNALLDEVEDLKSKADSIARADGMSQSFNTREVDIPGSDSKGGFPILRPEVKEVIEAFGFKPGKIALGTEDPGKQALRQLASALYWKTGEKDFFNYLSRMPAQVKAMGMELKDLATQPGPYGGYLVGDTQLGILIELQAEETAMRRLATVLPPIPGGSAITPSEENELSDPTWTTEILTGSDDTIAPFGNRVLTPHPLAKRIKVSRTLLRGANLLDVEAWILSRLARKFDAAEENGFVNGSGAQQPQGLLTASITSVTGGTADTIEPEDIINVAYQLPSAYAARASWLCNRSFIRKVRLLRDDSGGAGTGQFLWQPGLSDGNPSTLLEWPYFLSDSYPTGLSSDVYVTGEVVATFGDFSNYWIVDSLNLEVQRLEELYAATNQVGFIGRKESDGMVVNVDAFRNLEIS